MVSIFELASFNKIKNLVIIRSERVKREGSPPFTYFMPATAAAAIAIMAPGTSFPASRKYEPLDFLEITNNDTVDLQIAINGNSLIKIVPAGTIQTIRNQPLWHISLTNLGGVQTTLNKIVLVMQKEALTIDEYVRRQK